MVAVEPQERDQVVWWLWNHGRDQVVWWLWNHGREIRLHGGCGNTGEGSGCMVAVEPWERDQVVWWLWNHGREIRLYGGCGTTGERSGCMVAVEPWERDQVVWWLWNHRREIRLYGGCGTMGERLGFMVAVEPLEFYYLREILDRGHHKHVRIFMLKNQCVPTKLKFFFIHIFFSHASCRCCKMMW
jgi:hypothetical protein